tara:strand:- start:429 stop:1145 length:717 start_codon:yes stop_codon:yes gene_type:complete
MIAVTDIVLAIIPARGGSKGLPRKNMKVFNGQPLIFWTIQAALASRCITHVVVTSDDDEVLDFAKGCGVEPLKRPAGLAEDHSSMIPVISHSLKSIEDSGIAPDYCVLLQPTSPLRRSHHIDAAFDLVMEKKAAAGISVIERSSGAAKWFLEKDGYMKGLVDNEAPFQQRQNLPRVLSANGAIYIVKCDFFSQNLSLLPDCTVPYLMEREDSIDIDTIDEFLKAEGLFSGSLFNSAKS